MFYRYEGAIRRNYPSLASLETQHAFWKDRPDTP